jgi:hypothetical protein
VVTQTRPTQQEPIQEEPSFLSLVMPSRAFLRRFYDLLTGLKCKKPYYLVRLNHKAKADVALWLQFLEKNVKTVTDPTVLYSAIGMFNF